MLSEEEWKDWLLHPATKCLQAWAAEQRQDLMEMWAEGSFSAAFDIEMAVKNAGATGACSIYNLVRELDYNLIVEKDDGEQIGPTAERESGVDSAL